MRIDIDNVTRVSGNDKRLISFRISKVPGSLDEAHIDEMQDFLQGENIFILYSKHANLEASLFKR